MKIITFASWKGGTGKTSLTTACIELLAEQRKSILIVDLDSNLSISSVYNMLNQKYTSIDLLNGQSPAACYVNRYINIIPSDLKIARLNNISDRVLKNQIKKHIHFENNLQPFGFENYNYIFIDPPGTMNALTRNAMVAADKIIIPAMFSDIDYQATKLILEEMEICGIEADIQIVLNRYDSKRNTPEIEKLFRNNPDLQPFLWSGKIPAMKSISRLTSELSKGYTLKAQAKQIIENFIQEVIL